VKGKDEASTCWKLLLITRIDYTKRVIASVEGGKQRLYARKIASQRVSVFTLTPRSLVSTHRRGEISINLQFPLHHIPSMTVLRRDEQNVHLQWLYSAAAAFVGSLHTLGGRKDVEGFIKIFKFHTRK
jgi:hypothetical protein